MPSLLLTRQPRMQLSHARLDAAVAMARISPARVHAAPAAFLLAVNSASTALLFGVGTKPELLFGFHSWSQSFAYLFSSTCSYAFATSRGSMYRPSSPPPAPRASPAASPAVSPVVSFFLSLSDTSSVRGGSGPLDLACCTMLEPDSEHRRESSDPPLWAVAAAVATKKA